MPRERDEGKEDGENMKYGKEDAEGEAGGKKDAEYSIKDKEGNATQGARSIYIVAAAGHQESSDVEVSNGTGDDTRASGTEADATNDGFRTDDSPTWHFTPSS